MIQNNFGRLLQKEMDRKEFLKYSATFLLAVIGLSGIINAIMSLGNDTAGSRGSSGGYGGK